MTRTAAQLLNVLVPGAGLIPVRREWLGLSLAVLFALCLNIWIAGLWIAPVAVPAWLAWLALAISAAGWVSAQVLLVHHARRFDGIAAEIDTLLAQARRDIDGGDVQGAHTTLEAAAALDAERPDVLAAQADLCESQADAAEAARLRQRIVRIAPRSEWALAAQKSLSSRKSRASESARD